MRDVLIRIRDAQLGIPEAAQELRSALSRTGQYLVLAEYICGALAGYPPDPETLALPEDS